MKYLSLIKSAVGVVCGMIYMSLALSPAAFADTPDFNIKTNIPPHIVFVGDSIVTGYGLEGYSEEDVTKCPSYFNILSAVFDSELPDQADFKSYNMGVNGLTSAQLLENLENGDMDEELKDADCVILSIGGNDLLGPFLGVFDTEGDIGDMIKNAVELEDTLDSCIDEYRVILPDIVGAIYEKAENEDLHLFVQTLFDPFQQVHFKQFRELSEKEIGALNDIIIDISDNGSRYQVVDIASAFDGRSEELTNINDLDIHPNAEGHKLIAENVDSAVKSQTYTYYDHEAAMQYELEQAQLRQLKKQNELKKRKYIVIGSGTAAVAASAFGVAAAIRRRKRS